MKEPLEIIKYEPPTLKYQRVIEIVSGAIELYEKHLTYYYHTYTEEPEDQDDSEMPWIEKEIKYSCTFLRKYITGCAKEWRHGSQIWQVLISVNGMADNAYFYFHHEKHADQLIETIMNYVESI